MAFSFPFSVDLSRSLRFSFSCNRIPPPSLLFPPITPATRSRLALALAPLPLPVRRITSGLHRVLPVPPPKSGENTSRPRLARPERRVDGGLSSMTCWEGSLGKMGRGEKSGMTRSSARGDKVNKSAAGVGQSWGCKQRTCFRFIFLFLGPCC